MPYFNHRQKVIFSAENLFDINPLRKYELLFDNLACSPFERRNITKGRPPVSKSSLTKALIYKNLKPLKMLSDLVIDLNDNPSIAIKCGFRPSHIPPIERFSAFLRKTNNEAFQSIRRELVRELISLGEITGNNLSIDSCPIPANVKENNLKTSIKDRFDKYKIPRGDKDCKLGITVHYKEPFQKQIQYFWGYRNHVVSDLPSELPICEITKSANVSESKLFIPLFTSVQNEFNFSPTAVLGDSAYDAEYILEFIIDTLHAKPYIAQNMRWEAKRPVRISSKGGRICIAGFEMVYWGKFKDRGKIRRKFVCPITHSKSFAKKVPYCPWNHPRFENGNGCVAYLRGNKNIRKNIDYGSEDFKKTYNMRTGSERIFSRLLTLCMQDPSVKGLNATANHCTIAHITVLLVALTAVKTGNKDKIRFIKSFLPNL